MKTRNLVLVAQENLEELAMLESLDNGKPISASKSGDLPQVSTCTASSILQFTSASGLLIAIGLHHSRSLRDLQL
jgi:hypothetical protein